MAASTHSATQKVTRSTYIKGYTISSETDMKFQFKEIQP